MEEKDKKIQDIIQGHSFTIEDTLEDKPPKNEQEETVGDKPSSGDGGAENE